MVDEIGKEIRRRELMDACQRAFEDGVVAGGGGSHLSLLVGIACGAASTLILCLIFL